MRIALLVCALALSGCEIAPPEQAYVSPEAARHCEYVGAMHNNREYGSIMARRACLKYVRDTGELPPPS